MGDLTNIGIILGLISGIIAIILGILGLIGLSLEVLSFGALQFGRGSLERSILQIVAGILLVLIYQNRISISDILVLAIVFIVLGLIGGGILAVLGGILILIDYLLVTSGSSRTTTTRRTYRSR